MPSKFMVCEHCGIGWIYKSEKAWYPQCWYCARAWKAERAVQLQEDWSEWGLWGPKQRKRAQRQAQRAAEHQAARKFLSQQDAADLSQDWDMLQSPPGLKVFQDSQYKEAAAALWENAEPAAQRLLREVGIPPPGAEQEDSPAKQISRCMQEYRKVTGIHRSLIAKKIRLQAKTEAIKKQFEDAVGQLSAISSKIEQVEGQLVKAQAQVKEKVDGVQRPQKTALTELLKEAGIDLTKDQEGNLDKLLATNEVEVAGLWKTEPGVPIELLDEDWNSYGPTRDPKRLRSNPLSRRSRSPNRGGVTPEA